jgi:hypothetical protein
LHFSSPQEKEEFESLLAGFVRCHAPGDEREYDAVHEFAKARFLLLDAELEETQYVANLKIRLTAELKKQGLDPAQHLMARVLEARSTDKALRSGMSRIRHLRTHAARALRDLERFKAERRQQAADANQQRMHQLRIAATEELKQKQELLRAQFSNTDSRSENGFVPAPAKTGLEPPESKSTEQR